MKYDLYFYKYRRVAYVLDFIRSKSNIYDLYFYGIPMYEITKYIYKMYERIDNNDVSNKTFDRWVEEVLKIDPSTIGRITEQKIHSIIYKRYKGLQKPKYMAKLQKEKYLESIQQLRRVSIRNANIINELNENKRYILEKDNIEEIKKVFQLQLDRNELETHVKFIKTFERFDGEIDKFNLVVSANYILETELMLRLYKMIESQNQDMTLYQQKMMEVVESNIHILDMALAEIGDFEAFKQQFYSTESSSIDLSKISLKTVSMKEFEIALYKMHFIEQLTKEFWEEETIKELVRELTEISTSNTVIIVERPPNEIEIENSINFETYTKQFDEEDDLFLSGEGNEFFKRDVKFVESGLTELDKMDYAGQYETSQNEFFKPRNYMMEVVNNEIIISKVEPIVDSAANDCIILKCKYVETGFKLFNDNEEEVTFLSSIGNEIKVLSDGDRLLETDINGITISKRVFVEVSNNDLDVFRQKTVEKIGKEFDDGDNDIISLDNNASEISKFKEKFTLESTGSEFSKQEIKLLEKPTREFGEDIPLNQLSPQTMELLFPLTLKFMESELNEISINKDKSVEKSIGEFDDTDNSIKELSSKVNEMNVFKSHFLESSNTDISIHTGNKDLESLGSKEFESDDDDKHLNAGIKELTKIKYNNLDPSAGTGINKFQNKNLEIGSREFIDDDNNDLYLNSEANDLDVIKSIPTVETTGSEIFHNNIKGLEKQSSAFDDDANENINLSGQKNEISKTIINGVETSAAEIVKINIIKSVEQSSMKQFDDSDYTKNLSSGRVEITKFDFKLLDKSEGIEIILKDIRGVEKLSSTFDDNIEYDIWVNTKGNEIGVINPLALLETTQRELSEDEFDKGVKIDFDSLEINKMKTIKTLSSLGQETMVINFPSVEQRERELADDEILDVYVQTKGGEIFTIKTKGVEKTQRQLDDYDDSTINVSPKGVEIGAVIIPTLVEVGRTEAMSVNHIKLLDQNNREIDDMDPTEKWTSLGAAWEVDSNPHIKGLESRGVQVTVVKAITGNEIGQGTEIEKIKMKAIDPGKGTEVGTYEYTLVDKNSRELDDIIDENWVVTKGQEILVNHFNGLEKKNRELDDIDPITEVNIKPVEMITIDGKYLEKRDRKLDDITDNISKDVQKTAFEIEKINQKQIETGKNEIEKFHIKGTEENNEEFEVTGFGHGTEMIPIGIDKYKEKGLELGTGEEFDEIGIIGVESVDTGGGNAKEIGRFKQHGLEDAGKEEFDDKDFPSLEAGKVEMSIVKQPYTGIEKGKLQIDKHVHKPTGLEQRMMEVKISNNISLLEQRQTEILNLQAWIGVQFNKKELQRFKLNHGGERGKAETLKFTLKGIEMKPTDLDKSFKYTFVEPKAVTMSPMIKRVMKCLSSVPVECMKFNLKGLERKKIDMLNQTKITLQSLERGKNEVNIVDGTQKQLEQAVYNEINIFKFDKSIEGAHVDMSIFEYRDAGLEEYEDEFDAPNLDYNLETGLNEMFIMKVHKLVEDGVDEFHDLGYDHSIIGVESKEMEFFKFVQNKWLEDAEDELVSPDLLENFEIGSREIAVIKADKYVEIDKDEFDYIEQPFVEKGVFELEIVKPMKGLESSKVEIDKNIPHIQSMERTAVEMEKDAFKARRVGFKNRWNFFVGDAQDMIFLTPCLTEIGELVTLREKCIKDLTIGNASITTLLIFPQQGNELKHTLRNWLADIQIPADYVREMDTLMGWLINAIKDTRIYDEMTFKQTLEQVVVNYRKLFIEGFQEMNTVEQTVEAKISLSAMVNFFLFYEQILYVNKNWLSYINVEEGMDTMKRFLRGWIDDEGIDLSPGSNPEDNIVPLDYIYLVRWYEWYAKAELSFNGRNYEMTAYQSLINIRDQMVNYFTLHWGIREVEYGPDGMYIYSNDLSRLDKIRGFTHKTDYRRGWQYDTRNIKDVYNVDLHDLIYYLKEEK